MPSKARQKGFRSETLHTAARKADRTFHFKCHVNRVMEWRNWGKAVRQGL